MFTERYEPRVWLLSLSLTGWHAWGEIDAATVPALAAGLALLLVWRLRTAWPDDAIQAPTRSGRACSQPAGSTEHTSPNPQGL